MKKVAEQAAKKAEREAKKVATTAERAARARGRVRGNRGGGRGRGRGARGRSAVGNASAEEVFTLPGLFHMESMWNPWNECWLRPQPIFYSMDIMDSTWNGDGMVMD